MLDTHLLIFASMDELCESLYQLLFIQPLGGESKQVWNTLKADVHSWEVRKDIFRELTWRTSCLKGAGSTQLMRRSSRSIMAEASICFSTRPMKPSFFFRKVITWETKQSSTKQTVCKFFLLCSTVEAVAQTIIFSSAPVRFSWQWDCQWFCWRSWPVAGWGVGPAPESDRASQGETPPHPAYRS